MDVCWSGSSCSLLSDNSRSEDREMKKKMKKKRNHIRPDEIEHDKPLYVLGFAVGMAENQLLFPALNYVRPPRNLKLEIRLTYHSFLTACTIVPKSTYIQ